MALALPLLPTQRQPQPDGETPLLLVASDRGRQIVRAANEAALALGLTPGLALADARAAVPDVAVAAFDPDGDAACLDWLARGATRWSPLVRACPPHGLLIDISGCAHLFGGEASLVADAVTRLGRLGFSAQPALAATPAAAMALARFGARSGGERVDDLPLAALSELESVQTALRRAGLKCVGDVARLPRAAIAARFGEALVAALDQLREAAPEPLDPLLPAAPMAAQRRFAQPVASHDAVRAALAKLLLAVQVKLTALGAGGRRFALALYRADGHVAEVAVETAAPQRDPAVLLRLFDERIAALNDPLDPGFGYDLLRLAVPITAPLAETQLGLDGGALAETQLTALVDRLSARLGQGRLKRLARADSHIPEQASFLAALGHGEDSWPAPDPGEPPGRPIRMFDPPQPIEVLAEVPDGPPRRFRWRGCVHDVTAHEGPERIAAQWWRRKDGAGLTRDYWRVEDAQGQRYWLFRHGLYEQETDSPRWYIHGLFA
ncbi:MAG: DNA polymerase Y family protein [Alphaproteobacteria bacterium]|nr:DNA polymerase Y family protein [Alphaproteobacteria bacterium]